MTEYQLLIKTFLDKGYQPSFFNQGVNEKNKLLLRHDIDFSVDYAHMLSQQEDSVGVKSSYFFLLSSHAYNLLEASSVEKVKDILQRGHQVSLHFDPTLYADIEVGFKQEKTVFETVFGVEIDFVSIHRPAEYFLSNPETFAGVRHTYAPKFFKEISYFSDSQGQFRFGHPLESEAFSNSDSMQLLIHPIWWVLSENTAIEKLNRHIGKENQLYQQFVAENCIPYSEYLNTENSKAI